MIILAREAALSVHLVGLLQVCANHISCCVHLDPNEHDLLAFIGHEGGRLEKQM